MNKSTKKWLTVATFLAVIGIIMFIAVMTAYHWDFSRLGTDKPETNTYGIKEDFDNIKFNTETADILFAVSDDGMCKAVCLEHKNLKYSVNVQNNTLTVTQSDKRKWYEHIGINIHSPKITVYLPKTEYASLGIKESTGDIEIPSGIMFGSADISLSTGDVNFLASVSKSVKIKASTGDIRVSNISADTLDVRASTGKITVSHVTLSGDMKANTSTGNVNLRNVKCQNLSTSGSTGDAYLKNVISAGKFSVKRSTGNVEFSGSDAAEISVKTSTGDVKGALLSEKVFITASSTGKISVPRTTKGGKCEITTSTGDIKIEIN